MNQPKFTLWPWGTLAICVPLMAFGCSAIAGTQEKATLEETLIVFFSVLAAANGYLFAMAVGDFGRSIVAMPAGAVAGFVAVKLFAFPIAAFLFLIPLIAIAFFALVLRGRPLSGCAMMIGLAVCTLVFSTTLTAKADPAYAPICAYPFICGCITATMPLTNDSEGYWQAWFAGTRSALFGMAPGLFGLAVGAMLIDALLRIFRVQGDSLILPALSISIWLAVTNYFCVRDLFLSVYRTGSLESTSVEEDIGVPDDSSLL